MAKAFSVASWNVEHFGITDARSNKPKRPVKPIIDFLARQRADIVAIYEVRSPTVYGPLLKNHVRRTWIYFEPPKRGLAYPRIDY